MNEPISSLLRRAIALRRDGRTVYACLLTKSRGSTPQSAGALMLVDDAAAIHGTIGGGCVEAEVRRRAHELLVDGASGVMRFTLDHDYGWDDGLICGGTIEVAAAPMPEVELLEQACRAIDAREATSVPIVVDTEDGPARYIVDLPPRERLYIAGVGHIGQALARLALTLEFDVTIFDDRADLLEKYAPAGTADDRRSDCRRVTRRHGRRRDVLRDRHAWPSQTTSRRCTPSSIAARATSA